MYSYGVKKSHVFTWAWLIIQIRLIALSGGEDEIRYGLHRYIADRSPRTIYLYFEEEAHLMRGLW